MGWEMTSSMSTSQLSYRISRISRTWICCWRALTRQTHPRSGLQVVIADDGSSRPPDVGAGSPALDVVVVRQADLGFRAGAARNLGASAADGSVLLFLDGDTVPEPEYTARLARLPALLPDALVGGRRRYADLQAGQQMSIPGANGVAEYPEPEWLVQEYRRSGNLLAGAPTQLQVPHRGCTGLLARIVR